MHIAQWPSDPRSTTTEYIYIYIEQNDKRPTIPFYGNIQIMSSRIYSQESESENTTNWSKLHCKSWTVVHTAIVLSCIEFNAVQNTVQNIANIYVSWAVKCIAQIRAITFIYANWKAAKSMEKRGKKMNRKLRAKFSLLNKRMLLQNRHRNNRLKKNAFKNH